MRAPVIALALVLAFAVTTRAEADVCELARRVTEECACGGADKYTHTADAHTDADPDASTDPQPYDPDADTYTHTDAHTDAYAEHVPGEGLEGDDDDWITGAATYYTSNDGGAYGAGGKELRAFESVAVPMADFERLEGARVEIRGVGTFVVDDGCAGSGCKDFDFYVGDDEDDARQLPDWEQGIMTVQYKWV